MAFQARDIISDSEGTRCVVLRRVEIPCCLPSTPPSAERQSLGDPRADASAASTPPPQVMYRYELVDVDMMILRLMEAERDWCLQPDDPQLVEDVLTKYRIVMAKHELLLEESQATTNRRLLEEWRSRSSATFMIAGGAHQPDEVPDEVYDDDEDMDLL